MPSQNYFKTQYRGLKSIFQGLGLTLSQIINAALRRHKSQVIQAETNYFEGRAGIETLEYPYEQIPVPDHGRYRLHNEIDDCIVCDKCAKICPVNCIDIVTIKSPEEFGKTSDGSSKRLYAERFDIDMAKCCYCGLCTTVCPTECLTMTKVYDFSETDVRKMTYHFSNLTPEQAAEKKAAYETYLANKTAAKAPKVGNVEPQPKPTPAATTKAPDEAQTTAPATSMPESTPASIDTATDATTTQKADENISNQSKSLPPWLRNKK